MTKGEVHDCKIAPEFVEQLPKADYIIADKGYDKEELREIIKKKVPFLLYPEKVIQQ